MAEFSPDNPIAVKCCKSGLGHAEIWLEPDDPWLLGLAADTLKEDVCTIGHELSTWEGLRSTAAPIPFTPPHSPSPLSCAACLPCICTHKLASEYEHHDDCMQALQVCTSVKGLPGSVWPAFATCRAKQNNRIDPFSQATAGRLIAPHDSCISNLLGRRPAINQPSSTSGVHTYKSRWCGELTLSIARQREREPPFCLQGLCREGRRKRRLHVICLCCQEDSVRAGLLIYWQPAFFRLRLQCAGLTVLRIYVVTSCRLQRICRGSCSR